MYIYISDKLKKHVVQKWKIWNHIKNWAGISLIN